MTLSAWEKFNKENEMYPVGQQADLHTKKKGAAQQPKTTTLRAEVSATQEQLAAAMIREAEHLGLLRECLCKLEWVHMKFDDIIDIGLIERIRGVV